MNEQDFSAPMGRALALAALHRPHPNPRVGSVVLAADGNVVGEGAHETPGQPHAERLALAEAGARAEGGTLVVTLEPCDHLGRTPACTEAIIAAGVRRVVMGIRDPDTKVSGRGVARLRSAGIEVIEDVRAEEARALDPGYFVHRLRGRPRVILKVAMTLDGQTAAVDGRSRWISGEPARADAHRLRSQVDAVMVGAGTVIADDPLLTARTPGFEGPQPLPVVVSGSRPIPPGARLWGRDPLVLAPGPARVPAGDVIEVPGRDGAVDLDAGLKALGERGLLDVLVEGGASLAASLWKEGLVDEGVWYVAGRMAGGLGIGVFDAVFESLGGAAHVDITHVRRLGPDLRIDWRL